MNIRTLTASALLLAALTSGALAGKSDFIINSTAGVSDDEASYSIGRSAYKGPVVVELSSKGLVAVSPQATVGDFIDESPAESNQRSSNR